MTCGDWAGATPCTAWFDGAASGSAEDTSGATQGCYEYHLSVAQTMEPEVHCPHATGAEVCVASERAVSFCDNYVGTCGEWMGNARCTDWFDAAAPGTADDTSGATQGCYEYHLSVAQTMEPEVHCPHAAGLEVCVE